MLLIDNQYFGNINYYKEIVAHSNISFEQYDQHKNKQFSNRTVILGANGIIMLSIPLEKGRTQRTISKDVRISNAEKWQLQHWRSIVSSYNNAPWFKYFSDDLSVLYSLPYKYLFDWNLACFSWTMKFLKLPVNYQLTSQWVEKYHGGINDLRNSIIPGKENQATSQRYPQVFESRFDFVPGLSILDLLCCEGSRGALLFLKTRV